MTISSGWSDPKRAACSGPVGSNLYQVSRHLRVARVTVRGTPGEDVGLWRFGFIQLGFINADWAHYRKPNPAEGSVFVARDRPPALEQQLCRDSVAEPGVLGGLERFPFMGPIIFYDPDAPITSWLSNRITGVLPSGTKVTAGMLPFEIWTRDSPSPHWWGLTGSIAKHRQSMSSTPCNMRGHLRPCSRSRRARASQLRCSSRFNGTSGGAPISACKRDGTCNFLLGLAMSWT